MSFSLHREETRYILSRFKVRVSCIFEGVDTFVDAAPTSVIPPLFVITGLDPVIHADLLHALKDC